MTMGRLAGYLERFEPRTRTLAVARSVIALCQAAVIVFNSDSVLFGSPVGPRAGCRRIESAALWCVSGSTATSFDVARTAALAVLVCVIVGYRPALSCLPHWYVSASMSTCITPADGGLFAAQSAALLLIPVCLGDRRCWQWVQPVAPLPPRWAGRSAAAMLVLRCQATVVYAEAALSKWRHPAWHDGRALQAVFLDPEYGLPKPMRSTLEPVLSSSLLMIALGLAVIGVELLIALFFLSPRRLRRFGVCLVFALHAGIIICMGLLPFGVIMCAIAVLTLSPKPAQSAGLADPEHTAKRLGASSVESAEAALNAVADRSAKLPSLVHQHSCD